MKRRHYVGATTATLAGLAGCLGDTEYSIASVSAADTVGPLVFEVEPVKTTITVDSPGSLNLTLRNDGPNAVDIRNTGVWPFGVAALYQTEGSESRTLLLTDQYTQTDRVEVTANSTTRDNTPLVRSLDAGESVTEQYIVHGNRLYGSGTYALGGFHEAILFSYRTDNSDGWSEFRPEVSVRFSERSLLP